ncbi:PTS sugar transporter [Actinomycetaceae bacterium WB03_NA08]|uniref:PTS sugar transporter n=1 Tax=Scrofimicrobium canadense TaxID=2652290 RepID=A0A6N7W5Y7_9ACTO|nr:glucose PTS transporter subunit EIIB [Scrofimicrobium canadense]MSS83558.1 PTS sugar transporter [Scrofimicrobium canadense]
MTTPELILKGLGGADNVSELEACITRLRVEVAQPDLVDEVILKEAGAFGVVQVDDIVQVVVGPTADQVAKSVNSLR